MRLLQFKHLDNPILPENGCGLCLGHFDGVHVGHRALFGELKRLNAARDQRLPLGVLCFTTPPAATLLKTPTPQLTTLEEKLALIKAAGLDFAVLYDFPAVMNMTPEDFIDRILINDCHAEMLVCGFNYSFGARGVGQPTDLIRHFGKDGKRTVSVMPPVTDGNSVVSSSLIRAMLQNGHPDDAARLLGRCYSLTGEVREGFGRGRTIGLPTANLLFPAGLLVPKHGVYATTVRIGKRTYTGICNVGVRPTVNSGTDVTCETYIFDYNSDLYGKTLTVSFLHYLREEKKFSDLWELEAQVRLDIQQAKAFFR